MRACVVSNVSDGELASIFQHLPRLAGGCECLREARQVLAKAPPAIMQALEQMESLAETIGRRYPEARLHFDLSELHSFSYHTGLWFSAFAPGYGRALATGGRYDHVGEVFGRARPATGFHIDVTALSRLLPATAETAARIYAPASEDPRQFAAIRALRQQGETVISGFPDEQARREEINCDRQLVEVDGEYKVLPWEQ